MKTPALHYFLCAACNSDDYPPLDGAYVKFAYGRRLSLKTIRGFWRDTARRSREVPGGRPMGLYIHWPFCRSRCTYCFCDAYELEAPEEQRKYARLLKREIESLRDVLKGVPFTSIYMGGGTPTLAPAGVLDELFGLVRRSFTIAPDAQFYVEASPATLNEAKLRVFQRHGVNRTTLGVQTLQASVLKKVNRLGQTLGRVERLVSAFKRGGITFNIDFMAGLEGQSPRDFVRDISRVARWRPDMLHLYHFDPRPHVGFSREGKRLTRRRIDEIRVMLKAGDRLLRSAGYRLAREAWNTPELEAVDDRQDLEWRRYNGSILGLGANALSHAFGSGWYQHPLNGSGRAEPRAVETYEGFRVDMDEEMRSYVIRNADTLGRIPLAEFRRVFGRELMDVPFLKKPVREFLREGKAAIEGRDLRFLFDPMERLVLLKRFYSRKIVSAFLSRRKGEYRDFRKRLRREGEAGLRRMLLDVERGRFASLRYFRPKKRRREAGRA